MPSQPDHKTNVTFVILSLSGSVAIFQVDLGQLVPECLHSGFTGDKDDGSGGENRSYNTWKATVISSPPTNQNQTFFQAG